MKGLSPCVGRRAPKIDDCDVEAMRAARIRSRTRGSSWKATPTRACPEARVQVTATGASRGTAVTLAVPAGSTRTILADELESGGEGSTGALGDGRGKWRLRVESEEPIIVMNLLSSPAGHLTNLSTAPGFGGT